MQAEAPFEGMALRSLMGSLLLIGSVWAGSVAQAATPVATPVATSMDQRKPTQAFVRSRISEVDACNQGQYQIPDGSLLQGFRYGTTADKEGPLFECTVSWSNVSKGTATGRPILFPTPVQIPVIWSGWF